jgi:hypothetical protein
LLDARRITRQRLPAGAQVELMEFFMFLVDGDEESPLLQN